MIHDGRGAQRRLEVVLISWIKSMGSSLSELGSTMHGRYRHILAVMAAEVAGNEAI